MGAEKWMSRLTWPGMSKFNTAPRVPYYVSGDNINVAGFSQTTPLLTMWLITKSGHMAPLDQPAATLHMVQATIAGKA